jgi:lipopolysaccharide export LptBFGC system permease protein LptF
MNFTFTSFDKAIVAAILAPLFSLLSTYLAGGEFDQKTIGVAIVAALVAGVGVYLKGNLPTTIVAKP